MRKRYGRNIAKLLTGRIVARTFSSSPNTDVAYGKYNRQIRSDPHGTRRRPARRLQSQSARERSRMPAESAWRGAFTLAFRRRASLHRHLCRCPKIALTEMFEIIPYQGRSDPSRAGDEPSGLANVRMARRRLRLGSATAPADAAYGSGYGSGYGLAPTTAVLRRRPHKWAPPKQALPGSPTGIIADARLDLRVRSRIGWRTPRTAGRFWRTSAVPSPRPAGVHWRSAGPGATVTRIPCSGRRDGSPRRMGRQEIRDAASCSSLRMAVGPDCACVLERYAASSAAMWTAKLIRWRTTRCRISDGSSRRWNRTRKTLGLRTSMSGSAGDLLRYARHVLLCWLYQLQQSQSHRRHRSAETSSARHGRGCIGPSRRSARRSLHSTSTEECCERVAR